MSQKTAQKIIFSPASPIKSILEKLKIIACEDEPVLFVGETGTGKELFSDYLYKNSKRKGKYNKINCMGLPENLIESELLGHTKGSFTGASTDKTGLIEASNNGILFLDELGALAESMQAKLLRVIEDKKVRKVGTIKEKEINVQFIAATNKPDGLIPDLRFRFPYQIEIPPLRRRKKDLPYLLEHLLKETRFNSIDILSLMALESLGWEGNVRELANFIKNAEIELRYKLESGKFSKNDPSALLFSWHRYGKPVSLSQATIYQIMREYTTFDDLVQKFLPSKYYKNIKMPDDYYMLNKIAYEHCILLDFNSFPEVAREIQGLFRDLLTQEGVDALIKLLLDPMDIEIELPTGPIDVRLKEEFLGKKDAAVLEKIIYRMPGSFGDKHLKMSEILFAHFPELYQEQHAQIAAYANELAEKNLASIGILSTKSETPKNLYDLKWDEAKKEFSKRYFLKAFKKYPDLTNKKLGEKIGVSRPIVQKWKAKLTPKQNKA